MQQRCHISHEHFSGGDAEVSSCFDLIFSRYSPDMSKRSSDKYVWPPRNMCLHSTYWVPLPSRSPKQKNITLKKTSSGPEPLHKKKMIKILCIKKPKKKTSISFPLKKIMAWFLNKWTLNEEATNPLTKKPSEAQPSLKKGRTRSMVSAKDLARGGHRIQRFNTSKRPAILKIQLLIASNFPQGSKKYLSTI